MTSTTPFNNSPQFHINTNYRDFSVLLADREDNPVHHHQQTPAAPVSHHRQGHSSDSSDKKNGDRRRRPPSTLFNQLWTPSPY